MFQFTYDAWNRLVKVTKAYRDPDSSYALTANMIVDEIAYDGLHRRVVKQVKNSGGLDCTYHYYYDYDTIVEIRNGSEQVIQQFVWGENYIDELVEVRLNADPVNDEELANASNIRAHFALHNRSYNIIGLVDDSGALVEKYEFTPYGERQVYTSAGLNDPDCYAPIKKSKRFQISGIDQPYGLNPVGHQGLFHDEETELINNRRRILHSRLGKFMQRDPIGYPDGLNTYEYVRGNPINFVDPSGLGATGPDDLDDRQRGGPYPEPEPEDPGRIITGNCCPIDNLQMALEILGVADPTPICDGINAIIYYCRGEKGEATLSVICIFPYAGDVVGKGAKIGKALKAADAAADVAKAADKAKAADRAANAAKQYEEITKAQDLAKKRRPKTKGKNADKDWDGAKRPKQSKIDSTRKSKQRDRGDMIDVDPDKQYYRY